METEHEYVRGDMDGVESIQPAFQVEPESKYEAFLEAPYKKFKEILPKMLKPGQRIMDIGSSIGNIESFIDEQGIECDITCIDVDGKALGKLKEKEFKHIKTKVIESDANEFISNMPEEERSDLIIVNATLHEINTPGDQRKYLRETLGKLKSHLTDGGRIIIGDYYYPDELTDGEVAAFIDYQARTINHADARNKFVKPNLIKETAEELGFEVEDLGPDWQIRAVDRIDRKYYVVSLKKVETNE